MDADQYLRTDALRADLRRQSIRSAGVQIASQAVQFALTVGSAMVLARLLAPEDFGLLAMVGTLTAFVVSIRDLGFPMATVQREDIDHQQVSALFWIFMKLNILTALSMALMAPVLAWFYDEPRLTAITVVIVAGIAVTGLTTQHESLLIRQMRFGILSLTEVGSLVSGITVGIGFALLGTGYWALVAQSVAASVTRTVALWRACRWRPAPYRHQSRRAPDLSSLLSYSRYLTGFRVMKHIGHSLDRVLVGYFNGATAVGLYDSAYRWSLYPVHQMYGPFSNLAVASFSRVQDEPAAYRASCRAGLLPLFAIAMPAIALMFSEPRLVIRILLGEQWMAAVPLFQLLCIAAFANSITRTAKWLLLSQGQTKRQFQWGIIDTAGMVIAVAIGALWGPYGVAMGFTLGTCVLAYPGLAYSLRHSHLSTWDFLGIAARPALASIAAAAALFAIGPSLPGKTLVSELLVKLTAFALAYVVIWVTIPGGRQTLADMFRLIREVKPHAPGANTGSRRARLARRRP